MKSETKLSRVVLIIIVVIVVIVVVFAIPRIWVSNYSKNNELEGSITNISEYPTTTPLLLVTLNNPKSLSNPYDVLITLDLPNGTAVALGWIALDEWRYGNFYAIVNIQQDNATDFTISTGTEIGLGNTVVQNYNFYGTEFILTYSGYSGAITYDIQ